VFEVFLDTFIICTLTALTILTSNIANGSYDSGEFFARGDSENALLAFSSNLGTFGSIAFSIILPLFAFTTILAWSYYGEKATEFCFSSCSEKGKKIATSVFKIIFVLFIVFAAVIESDLLWDLDDTFNGLMAIPNLIALVFLSGKVAKITNNYYKRKKGEKIAPMLSAYEDLNREFAEQLQMEETENAESTK